MLAASTVRPYAAGAAIVAAVGSTTTCSTGAEVAPLTRSTRFERSHPERSPGSVEMTTSSTVSTFCRYAFGLCAARLGLRGLRGEMRDQLLAA